MEINGMDFNTKIKKLKILIFKKILSEKMVDVVYWFCGRTSCGV